VVLQCAAVISTKPGSEPFATFLPRPKSLLQVLLCLSTAPVLPPKRKEDFGVSRFYGTLSDRRCSSSRHMATRFLSTIGAMPSLIFYL
jgi:hypothetical protein